ncbi:MAG: ATP-binding protein [Candidatus Margulisiibacteriota bacterium]
MKPEFEHFLEQRLQSDLNFIQVVLGPRQVGKTTALKSIVSRWKGPTLMVTADEVAAPTESWIEVQWKLAKSMGNNVLLVFDEIQKVRDWSRVIKVMFDQERASRSMKVVLLGSASLSIQQGLSESLAGRFELIFAPHWSYTHCKEAFGWNLETYLTYGGYPGAAELVSNQERWEDYVKYGIIEPVLSKDILQVATVHKPALFRQCFELAMAYPAQEISLTKLLGQLQDKGNITTIQHYLTLFEGAFLVKALQKYGGSELRRRSSAPKLLPLNNALPQALHGSKKEDSIWKGRLLEAAVGAHLSLQKGQLSYYRDGNDEVDFVFQTNEKLYAIEVKSDHKASRHRGLEKFLKIYPNAVPMIIDRNAAETFFTTSLPA